MKPPKCKTCGAEEWRHVCGPRGLGKTVLDEVARCESDSTAKAKRSFPPKTVPKSPAVSAPSADLHGTPVSLMNVASALSGTSAVSIPSPKPSRKEYLRLKAVERRAAVKAGLTVQAYRAQQKEPSK